MLAVHQNLNMAPRDRFPKPIPHEVEWITLYYLVIVSEYIFLEKSKPITVNLKV